LTKGVISGARLPEAKIMQYKVVVGRDETAAIWFVEETNVPGLTLEDASFTGLIGKLPEAVAWLLRDASAAHDVPFEVLLADRERARLAR
jgi:hypothetical protein